MIRLKKNGDRRLKRGHLWIFSNEIAHPPVSELDPGSIHELQAASGEFLGVVYANPASLITARVLSRRKARIDTEFLHHRVEQALALRQRIWPGRDSFRLIYSESDLLPGLIVDRYGDVLVVQILTAGMDRLLNMILEALLMVVPAKCIYLRNDSPFRRLEGLEPEKRSAYGQLPEKVELVSDGLRFLVDVVNGQKTGFFLDQEANRPLMKQYVYPGARVLDLFCYTGAWAIHALAAGAAHAVGVDSSESALELAGANAQTNSMGDRFTGVCETAVDFLKKSTEDWDVIIIDPPAFIKSRSQLKDGLKGYIDVNRRALRRIKPGGILVTCSCSHHMDRSSFESVLSAGELQSGRDLRILDVRGQGPDHPILLSMPETRYLKVMVAQAI